MLPENDTKKPDFEKAELDLLREGLKRTHEERFKMMTLLMKRNSMLRNAKITHKPLAAGSKKVYRNIVEVNKEAYEIQ